MVEEGGNFRDYLDVSRVRSVIEEGRSSKINELLPGRSVRGVEVVEGDKCRIKPRRTGR